MNEVDIGDMVKHCDNGSVGVVKLVDGIAIWIHWFAENELNFAPLWSVEILQKSIVT
jgi:hypothetical protein